MPVPLVLIHEALRYFTEQSSTWLFYTLELKNNTEGELENMQIF